MISLFASYYSNSILRIVMMPITMMQMMAVIIDRRIAFQKLSSINQMNSQKGTTMLINPAQTQ